MIEIILLSILQGFTEFLPISSSSHLILVSKYLSFKNQGLNIDMSLHAGSLIAVIIYFKKDIIYFLKDQSLLYKIILSSIPVMIAGYCLVSLGVIDQLRNYKVIGWMTIIFGVFLYLSDKSKIKLNINDNFNYKSAIVIGCFQILSLIPGVSRSGIAISAARILKFNRADSVKISFLLSIPTLSAVSIFNFFSLYNSNNLNFSLLNILAVLLSFIISFITIKYFLIFIKKFSLNIFVIYRIILGSIILLYLS